jgi:hypothetical protein
MVPKSKNSCNETTLLSAVDPLKGPRPWTAPQIEKEATTSIDDAMPVVPKRRADHSRNGTSE